MVTKLATKTKVEHLSVDDLMFDPDNPRLPPSVDGSDADEVLKWMLRDATLVELVGSIGEQGYFEGEPVLVAPAKRPKKGYRVVEGNRRLAAVMLLRDPTLAPVRKSAVNAMAEEAKHIPEVLPAIVFSTREEILDYLGYRHVTGVKAWDSLAKARYLRQMEARAVAEGNELTYRQLARMIGSRADYVRRLLVGLTVLDYIVDQDFFGLRGVDEDDISFSVLTTALSYEAIAEWTGVRAGRAEADPDEFNPDNLRRLVDWTFRETASGKSLVGESRNLKQLAAVVSEPHALDALLAGVPLDDAALLTKQANEAFREALGDATKKARLARDMTHRLHHVDEVDVEAASELAGIARDMYRLVRTRFEEHGED